MKKIELETRKNLYRLFIIEDKQLSDLSKIYNCNKDKVRYNLKKFNINKRNIQNNYNNKKIESITNKIIKEYKNLSSIKELCKKYKIPTQTLSQILKDHNILIRKNNRINTVLDFTGKKYNKLYIKSTYKKDNQGKICICKCDCGNITHIRLHKIISGTNKSCGCLLHSQYKYLGTYFTELLKQAARRNIEVKITDKYCYTLLLKQKYICPLTGLKISLFKKMNKGRGTASLDRIDSSKGYIKGNIRWIHKKINIMRSNMTDEELLYWCQLLVNNMK